MGNPFSYCSANALDTSLGGSGRVWSLNGRPGHQRGARSPVRRPASNKLACATSRGSSPLALMAGSRPAKVVTEVSGSHMRKEILAVAVSTSGTWANRSACSPSSAPAAQTSRSATISPFFCAGDFRSSRLDIQHTSCQIARVHEKSGKCVKEKGSEDVSNRATDQKTKQRPKPTDSRS